MNLVWCTPIQPPARKSVALALADHCNDSGGSLRVSHATVALETGLSVDQARRYMRSFIAEGLLIVEANAAGGAPGMVPQYRLDLVKLRALADAVEPSREVNRIRKSRGLPELLTGGMDAPPPKHRITGSMPPDPATTGGTDAPPLLPETGGVDALPTGCADAPPFELTGGMDAPPQEGGRGAWTPETGCMDAPRTQIQEPNTKERNTSIARPSRSAKAKSQHAEPELFAAFYEQYPRKVARPKAAEAFNRIGVTAELLTTMLAAIERQGLRARCAAGEEQYVPHPATWLNQRRWEDQAPRHAPAPPPTSRSPPGPSRHSGFAERDYGELGDLSPLT